MSSSLNTFFVILFLMSSSHTFAQNAETSLKEIAGLKIQDKVEASRMTFSDKETRAAIFKFTPQVGEKSDIQDYLLSVNKSGLIEFVEIHRRGSSETFYLDWIEPSHEPNVKFFIRHQPIIKNAYTEATPRPDPNLGLGFRNPTDPSYSLTEVTQMLIGKKNGPFAGKSFKDESPFLVQLLASANLHFLQERGIFGMKDTEKEEWITNMQKLESMSKAAESGTNQQRPANSPKALSPEGEANDFLKK